MTFVRFHKLVTYLISALGLLALAIGGQLGPFTQVFLALGWVGSVFAEGPIIARPAWGRAWTGAVVGLLLLQVVRGLAGDPILALGVEFAAYLQISRLFNRRTARDHQQIAVLALLHLIAATVLTSSFGYALVFLGFVVVTPWMLTLSHLRREIEGFYPRRSDGQALDADRVLASRRVVGPAFFASTALLSVPLFVLTSLLFLAFPRVGVGFLSFGGGGGQPTAGFGRNVELGGFGTIRDDPTVVLRVTVPNQDEPPPHLNLRLRGTSFDHYDGRRWTRTVDGSVPLRDTRGHYPVTRWPQRQSDRPHEIVLEHLDEPVLFLPHRTVALTVPPRVRHGVPTSRRVIRQPGHDFRYVAEDELGLRYTAWVTPDPDEPVFAPLTEPERATYLQLPGDQQRLRALARELTEGATSDRERADRIARWLRDSGTFRYTLQQPRTGGEDPLEVFLFEAKAGHCEYFSTALSVLLRHAGVPSRNVTGFVGGRYNPYGGYYAVRQGDAHSWVEAHVGDRWVTYDPTPPARARMGPDEGAFADLRAILDALRTHWTQDVVGYDLRKQIGALRAIAGWARSLGLGRDGADRPSREAEGASETMAPWGIALLGIAVLAGAALVWWRWGRRRRLASRLPADAREAVLLYRSLERRLERCGVPRPDHVTPGEHAAALRARGFPGADIVTEITHRYEGARYGSHPLTPEENRRLRRRMGGIGAEKALRSDT